MNNIILENFIDRYNDIVMMETTSIDDILNEISFYEEFIPSFFSQSCQGKGISNMYSDIRKGIENGDEQKITCIDINQSNIIYKEYIEGMINFINDVKNVRIENSDNICEFTEKFENAKKRDSSFIKSLYDGRLNKAEDMVLSEAVGNVEFLIDFIPELKELKTKCYNINESIKEVQDLTQKQLLDNCILMMGESVRDFCFNSIKTVLETYESIRLTLESDNEPEHMEFILFM